MVPIQVRVPRPLRTDFKVLCAQRGTDVSTVLRTYIEQAVAKSKENQ